jgi:hypothetical protein
MFFVCGSFGEESCMYPNPDAQEIMKLGFCGRYLRHLHSLERRSMSVCFIFWGVHLQIVVSIQQG